MSLAITTLPPSTRLPDGAAKLPPLALVKLRTLTDRRDASRDLVTGATQRQQDAAATVRRLADALEQVAFDNRHHNGSHRSVSTHPAGTQARDGVVTFKSVADPRFAEFKAQHAAAVADLQRRSQTLAAAEEAFSPLAQIMSRLTEYLTANREASFRDVPAVAVKVTGRNAAQLEAARRAVAELVEERRATRDAPATDAEIRAIVEAHVAELAKSGRPGLAGIGRGEVDWPMRSAEVRFMNDGNGGYGGARVHDVLAVSAFLDPERMVERLFSAALEECRATGIAPGLSRDQRATAVAKLDAMILTAERTEEAAVEALEQAGYPATRRDDADPRAVLGITGPAPGGV